MLSETLKFPWLIPNFKDVCQPIPLNEFNEKYKTFFVIGRELGVPAKFKLYLKMERIETCPFLRLGVFLKLVEKCPGASEVRLDFKIYFPKPSRQGEIVGEYLNMAQGYPDNRGVGGYLIDEGDNYEHLPLQLNAAGALRLEVEITIYAPKN